MDSYRRQKTSVHTAPLSRAKVMAHIKSEKTYYLECHNADGTVEEFKLGLKTVNIGRSETCEITIPSVKVSRGHAEIFKRCEDYFIQDKDSSNGTFVNAVKVAKCRLRPDDVITIGEVEIIYREAVQKSS